MYSPNDDPDVTSGLQDDAKKEMTTPGTSLSLREVPPPSQAATYDVCGRLFPARGSQGV